MDFKKVSQAILQPTTPTILMKTLSNIYTLADLGPDIHIFAITGGPCSGKSTGMSKLYEYLTKRGYTVLVVPESATKLMQGGICISDTLPPKDFQELILRDIIAQEHVFWDAARILRDQGQKVIVLCDRGTMDGEAYAGESVFAEIVQKIGLELATISAQRYHAVFHMRSAACGAEQFYTCSNNATRQETVKEAAASMRRHSMLGIGITIYVSSTIVLDSKKRFKDYWQRFALCSVIRFQLNMKRSL
jgi:predicted ATPase